MLEITIDTVLVQKNTR